MGNGFIFDHIKSEKLYFFLVSLIIVTLPWNMNINSYCVVLCLAILIIDFAVFKKQWPRANKAMFILAIPFFLSISGLIFSENLSYGIKYLSRVISILIFPFMFLNMPRFNEIKVVLLLFLFPISTGLCYIYLFLKITEFKLGNLYQQIITDGFLLRLNESFSENEVHPTYFSLFLMFSIFISIYTLKLFRNNSWIRRFSFILILLSFMMLMSLTAKMPIASFFTTILVTIFILLLKMKRNVLLFGGGCLLTISLTIFIFIKIPNRGAQELYNYYNYLVDNKPSSLYKYDELGIEYDTFWWEKTNRIVIWKNSIELIGQTPVFGLGTGDVQDELIKVYKQNKELWRMQFFNSHNQYIDYWLRYGIIGLIIFTLMLLYVFRSAYKESNFLYFAFLLSFCLCCLTENLLQRHWGIVYFSLFNSLLFYNKYGSRKSPEQSNLT